jgi:mono/diheme cytochrome c family protein
LLKRLLFSLLAAVVLATGFYFLTAEPAIPPITPPAPASFARDDVQRGEILARAGNCMSCHTAKDGARFAGGHPIITGFGTIYSTNITPDAETGIGRWSEAAFARALREGVARDGSQLFPAFPFDHFTKLTDADIRALYAYLMSVPPVKAPRRANDLFFPADVRPLQAVWKMLYLDKGPYRPDPARSAEWNRGAYLVEGLTHCGACHTPRNVFGAEQVGHPYAGALNAGWIAPPLDISPSPARWTQDEFVSYLRGATTVHGRALGPMGEVVAGLAALPDSDIQAIAGYFMEFFKPMSATPEAEVARARAASVVTAGQAIHDRGARLYVALCASCHDSGSSRPAATKAELSLATSLWLRDSHNFLRAVLDGVGHEGDAPGAYMPPFRDVLNDADIEAIGTYLRRTRTRHISWLELLQAVRTMRADPLKLPLKP